MRNESLAAKVFRMGLLYVFLILICRFTKGYAAVAIVLLGTYMAIAGRRGWGLLSFIFLQSIVFMNATIVGRSSMLFVIAKFGIFVIGIAMVVRGVGCRTKRTIPLTILYVYLFFAAISSIAGWCPIISYFKLANFLLFLISIHLGLKSIVSDPKEAELVRVGLLAFVWLLICGSLIVYPFPSIGYSMMSNNMLRTNTALSRSDVVAMIKSGQTGMRLYSGLLNHSQTLAAAGVACFAWLLCDMVCLQRKIDYLHAIPLLAALPIFYLTRARSTLLGLVVCIAVVYFYLFPKLKIQHQLKTRVKTAITSAVFLLLACGLIMQVSTGLVSKWMRKQDDTAMDRRSLSEAVTESRMGVVNQCLRDFNMNPLIGMGFQTSEDHKILYQMGEISFVSAPIEKGVLPLMILGEGGVLGLLVFVVFLFCFYSGCKRKSLYATSALFTTLLVLNMSEASFFSPGGPGGGLWVILVVGGFVIDVLRLNRAPIMVGMVDMRNRYYR